MSDSRSSLETGSGSGSGGRKRVREGTGAQNSTPPPGDEELQYAADMKDAEDADDDEYFDVDMEAQDAYDEREAAEALVVQQGSVVPVAADVPFYPHLGAGDFDDEDLS